MKISTFENIDKAKANVLELEFSAMKELLSPEIGDKNGSGYNFVIFRNAYRRQNEIEYHTGLVLDFDSKESAIAKTKTELSDILNCVAHCLIDTYSNKKELPRYRLIVPFGFPISKDDYFQVQADIIEMLGYPPAIDEQARKNPAQFYYFSRHPSKQLEMIWHNGELYEPECQPFDTLKNSSKMNGSKSYVHSLHETGVGGRNNNLKAQCCAAQLAGKSIEETVQELLEYDKQNHQPALFSDPKENGFPDEPELAAMRFVTSIYCSQKQNYNVPTKQPELVEDIETLREQKKDKAKEIEFFDETLALEAPGLLGEIVNYIVDTAIKPQPVLALGAAIALLGHVKGHKYRTESNLRTNMYCLGLAPSGSGKEHNTACVTDLLTQIKDESSLIGEPASEPALANSIHRVKGRAILCWGEMGMIFREMMNPHSQKRVALRAINEFFSKAGHIYKTREYASTKDGKESKIIYQPHLSVWAESAPEPVLESLDPSFVDDGFLPRWLLFPVTRKTVKKQKRKDRKEACEYIVKQLKEIKSKQTMNLDLIQPKPMAQYVYNSDEAELFFSEIEDEIDRWKEKLDKESARLGTTVSRVTEQVKKLALIASNNKEITKKDAEWAYSVIRCCTNYSLKIVKDEITDSITKKFANRVLKILEGNSGVVNKRDIQRSTGWNSKTLSEIRDYLVDTEQIEIKDARNNRGRTSQIWTAI